MLCCEAVIPELLPSSTKIASGVCAGEEATHTTGHSTLFLLRMAAECSNMYQYSYHAPSCVVGIQCMAIASLVSHYFTHNVGSLMEDVINT